MNLWSHHFSQNTNKKLSGFLPCVVRAEILIIFCLYSGRNDDMINSFWNWLTFKNSLIMTPNSIIDLSLKFSCSYQFVWLHGNAWGKLPKHSTGTKVRKPKEGNSLGQGHYSRQSFDGLFVKETFFSTKI